MDPTAPQCPTPRSWTGLRTTSRGWKRRSSTERRGTSTSRKSFSVSTRSSRRSSSCREIACEDTDRFILSTTNLTQAADILKMLENQLKFSQKRHMEKEEKMSSLRLRLDV